MPGNVITAEVFAKYVDGNTSNWNAVLNNLMATIANSTAPAGTFVDGGAAGSIGRTTFPFIGTLTRTGDSGTGPKAYLNYLVFDRNYVYKSGGFKRLSSTPKENGSDVAHERLAFDGAQQISITEPGYVYLYISNENDTQVDVYFDDFKVTHTKGAIVSSQDYYAFVLTFNSYQRENSVENRYLYNQGTGDKKFNTERVFDLGLNIDLTKYRAYDPALGRWWQVDPLADEADFTSLTPYNYSFNNPIRYNDPEGDCPLCVTAGVGALVGGVAGAIASAANGGSWSDVGKAAVAGAVGGAVIGSGVGLLATGTVAATGLTSSVIGVVATNAAAGMVSGAAEETAKQVMDGKGINTTKIVEASAAGGAVNAVAGPLGKVVAGAITKAAAPVVKAVASTVAKSSAPAVVAAAQTATNQGVKAAAAAVKDVAKDATQKAVENKVQDKLDRK